jgi:phosphoglycerate kinase
VPGAGAPAAGSAATAPAIAPRSAAMPAPVRALVQSSPGAGGRPAARSHRVATAIRGTVGGTAASASGAVPSAASRQTTSTPARRISSRARAIAARAKETGCRILLPVDAVVAAELKAGIATRTVAGSAVPADQKILDIGPQTTALIVRELSACRTLVWNGPLGAFEITPFDTGTVAVARAVADLTRTKGLVSVAGGGDTVSALAHAGVEDAMTYVSAAGGAFLEWMEGKTLPGVAALEG